MEILKLGKILTSGHRLQLFKSIRSLTSHPSLKATKCLCSPPLLQQLTKHHYSTEPDTDEVSPKMKKYLADEAKHNGKLVYVGQLTRQLRTAKYLSLSSSAFGIAMLPFLADTLSTSSAFAQLFVYGTSSFFIFLTPLFSVFLTKRYVVRMYYNGSEQKLHAILLNFFMFEYKQELDVRDVFVPELPGPFSTVKVKSSGKSFFIDLDKVTDVNLVEKIMGYDKPFDPKKYTKK